MMIGPFSIVSWKAHVAVRSLIPAIVSQLRAQCALSERTLAASEGTEAHPRGVEPLTYGSEVRCSIQLSYGCRGKGAALPRIFAVSCGQRGRSRDPGQRFLLLPDLPAVGTIHRVLF